MWLPSFCDPLDLFRSIDLDNNFFSAIQLWAGSFSNRSQIPLFAPNRWNRILKRVERVFFPPPSRIPPESQPSVEQPPQPPPNSNNLSPRVSRNQPPRAPPTTTQKNLQTQHTKMATSTDSQGSAPVPTMPQPNDPSQHHMSVSSSSSISDAETERRGRSERPRMASRKPSASILVPRDHPEIEIEEEEFPPDDARAMSPRRNSADLERLGKEARQTLQE